MNAFGMERKSEDGGNGQYSSLQECHPGNGWTYWDELHSYADNDPKFHLQVVSSSDGNITKG